MRVELLDGWADVERRVVERSSWSGSLTETEARLLQALAGRPGKTLSREALLAEVWGYHPDSRTRTLDTAVRRLRRKLEPEPRNPQLILTAHGAGYRFAPPPVADVPTAREVARPAPRARVPVDTTRFFARQHEQSWLKEQLASERMVVVVGPGGVGKSRLARQAAHSWSMARGAEAWWCSLSGVSSGDDLTSRIAHRLRLRLPASGDRLSALGTRLARLGELLLVLDESDDLPEDLIDRLHRWVQHAPDLHLILTRCRRSTRPVSQLRLRPLDAPDARVLFLDRARARVPGFVPDAAALSRVLSALDGLPLELQLAAARVRVLDLTSLADRLEQGISILRDRSASGRHGSMQRVLTRSWSFLSPELRSALIGCTVFAGPFSLELADEVLEVPGEEVVDLIEALVDEGLLETTYDEQALQFRMLQSTRSFVREHTPADEPTGRRLAAVMAAAAAAHVDALHGPLTVAACRWLAAHRGDLDAALGHAPPEQHQPIAIAAGWAAESIGDNQQARRLWASVGGPMGRYLQGTLTDISDQERKALFQLARGSSPRLDAAIDLEEARLTAQQRGERVARPLLLAAVDAFTAAGDRAGSALTCGKVANACAQLGEMDSAARWRRRALEESGGPETMLWHRLQMVPYALPASDEPTIEALHSTAAVMRATGYRKQLSHALIVIAFTALSAGSIEPALAAAREAVAVTSGVESPSSRNGVLCNAGIVFRELAWFDEAMACFRTVEADLDGARPQLQLALTINQTLCLIDEGRLAEAAATIERAPRVCGRIADARVDVVRGVVAALRGQPDRPLWRAALRLYRDEAAPLQEAKVSMFLASIGEPDADALLQTAMTAADRHGDRALLLAAVWLWEQRGHTAPITPARGRPDPGRYLSVVRLVRRLSHAVTSAP